MVPIKPLPRIIASWARRSAASVEDYKAGISSPSRDWKEATLAANNAYITGIQAALANDMFQKGVNKAGSERWRTRTLTLGPSRWVAGIAAAGDAYVNGFRPYYDAISLMTLPPRGPVGDPANIARVAFIADRLHALKISGGQ